MREIALFGEDYAHEKVIGGLVQRRASEYGIGAQFNWRNAVGGHGRVVQELRTYLRDLSRQGGPSPDLIIVATDANCSGLNARIKEIRDYTETVSTSPVVLAVPDPHIERWLLLDGAAFQRVFGRGCAAPDQKCSRDLYKQRLVEAILEAGITPSFGGVEFAEDIVREMDIERAKRADPSLESFLDDLDAQFRQWRL